MYAIVRNDIHMTTGKIASQAGHAFLDTFMIALETRKEICEQYQDFNHGTKVVLSASLEQIETIYQESLKNNIPVAIVIDSGHIHSPDFDGNPIITALGIGPVLREETPFLSKLQLLK